jgi:hypothetical protein
MGSAQFPVLSGWKLENIELKDHREEFISCSCSQDKILSK